MSITLPSMRVTKKQQVLDHTGKIVEFRLHDNQLYIMKVNSDGSITEGAELILDTIPAPAYISSRLLTQTWIQSNSGDYYTLEASTASNDGRWLNTVGILGTLFAESIIFDPDFLTESDSVSYENDYVQVKSYSAISADGAGDNITDWETQGHFHTVGTNLTNPGGYGGITFTPLEDFTFEVELMFVEAPNNNATFNYMFFDNLGKNVSVAFFPAINEVGYYGGESGIYGTDLDPLIKRTTVVPTMMDGEWHLFRITKTYSDPHLKIYWDNIMINDNGGYPVEGVAYGIHNLSNTTIDGLRSYIGHQGVTRIRNLAITGNVVT